MLYCRFFNVSYCLVPCCYMHLVLFSLSFLPFAVKNPAGLFACNSFLVHFLNALPLGAMTRL